MGYYESWQLSLPGRFGNDCFYSSRVLFSYSLTRDLILLKKKYWHLKMEFSCVKDSICRVMSAI